MSLRNCSSGMFGENREAETVWRSWQVDEDVDVVDVELEDSRWDSERRGCRGGPSVETDDWLWPSLELTGDVPFKSWMIILVLQITELLMQ